MPQLVEMLHDPDPIVRFRAVKAIQFLSKDAGAAVPALREARTTRARPFAGPLRRPCNFSPPNRPSRRNARRMRP